MVGHNYALKLAKWLGLDEEGVAGASGWLTTTQRRKWTDRAIVEAAAASARLIFSPHARARRPRNIGKREG